MPCTYDRYIELRDCATVYYMWIYKNLTNSRKVFDCSLKTVLKVVEHFSLTYKSTHSFFSTLFACIFRSFLQGPTISTRSIQYYQVTWNTLILKPALFQSDWSDFLCHNDLITWWNFNDVLSLNADRFSLIWFVNTWWRQSYKPAAHDCYTIDSPLLLYIVLGDTEILLYSAWKFQNKNQFF